MNKQTNTKGQNRWQIEEKGKLIYYKDGVIFYEIEPETLLDKDRFYFLSLHPEIDQYDFLLHLIKACKQANLKELTITIDK